MNGLVVMDEGWSGGEKGIHVWVSHRAYCLLLYGPS